MSARKNAVRRKRRPARGWAWKLSTGRFFRFAAQRGQFYVWVNKPSPMFDQERFAIEHPGEWVRVPMDIALARAKPV